MEQAVNFAELEAVVDEVSRLVVGDPGLEEDIALLVSSILGKLALKGEKVGPLKTLQEVKVMLEERVARWPEQWLEQGRQEGEKRGMQKGMRKGQQKGIQKGLRQGMAELLKAQARHRFGELPAWAVERFDRADVETLDRWSPRLLDASRLEDVFDDSE